MTLPGIAGTVFVHPVLFLIAADNVEMFSILGSANNVSPTCCLLKRVVEEGEGDHAVGEDGRLGFSLSIFLCSNSIGSPLSLFHCTAVQNAASRRPPFEGTALRTRTAKRPRVVAS